MIFGTTDVGDVAEPAGVTAAGAGSPAVRGARGAARRSVLDADADVVSPAVALEMEAKMGVPFVAGESSALSAG